MSGTKKSGIQQVYCCKRGWTLEQSALVRYSAAVIGWANKAKPKVLIFNNK